MKNNTKAKKLIKEVNVSNVAKYELERSIDIKD